VSRYFVAVVGAGVIGFAAAIFAKARGADVSVVDMKYAEAIR
jgi:NADPH-dependent 2,4-dienoyl-CoA reductase/sulfur reductase-like enzyme